MGGLSYSSGTENRYRYNGKELHQEFNLGLYDYGFRWYDPTTARFVSVDPLAEDFPYNATYAYAENRPIDGIDLEGLEYLSYLNKFEYQGGASNVITAVDNVAIDVINEGIGLWNSAVSTVETIANEGLSGYGESLSNEVEALAEGVSNEVSDAVEYYSETSVEQIAQDVGSQLQEPEAIEVGVSTAMTFVTGKPNITKITSKAARREAMREAGIPTSQPLIPDRATISKDKVFLTRDKKFTVQDAKNDRSHPGQPHWEAGPTKENQHRPDGLNRSGSNNKPQMGKPKSKREYDE